MKILTFGDIHLSRANLEAMRPSLRWVLETIQARCPALVVCLGDLVQSRNESDHRVLYELVGFFDDLSSACPTVTLVGNHDIQYGPDEKHIYQSSLVHVVTPNTVVDWPTFWRGGADHHYSPFGLTPYYKGEIPVFAPFVRLLFCHGDIAEHPYGSTVLGPHIAEIGGPNSALTHIFCGHQHIPEILESHGRYFEFVGCLAPQSFSDAGDHPFGMVEIEADERTGAVSSITRVRNPHAKPYLKHTWREGKDAPELRQNAHHLVDVEGSPDFCREASKQLAPLQSVRVRTIERVSVATSELDQPAARPHEYVDELISRYGQAHGADPKVGRALYYDQEAEE